MESLFAKYGYTPDIDYITKRLDAIALGIDSVTSPAVLRKCMSIMDLTTLHTEDTVASVKKLVAKVNSFMNDYPDYPLPASICVYPNFGAVVPLTHSWPMTSRRPGRRSGPCALP